MLPVYLLPPEIPNVQIWFRYDVNYPFKYHRDCPDAGSWDTHTERTYEYAEELIKDLITHKDHF